MRRIRTLWASIALTALAGGGIASAADEDPIVAKLVDLEAKVAEHTAAKSIDQLKADAAEALVLYRENAGKDPHRERILKVFAGLAKHKSDDVVREALIDLGETGDREGAKILRPFLKPCDDPKPTVALETAILVCKKLPHEVLADPLLAIVDDSKNLKVAAKAMESLGAFGLVKSKRERILEGLVKSIAKSQSGGRGAAGKENNANPDAGLGNTSNAPAGNRWKELSEVLPVVLNELTGHSETSAEAWFVTFKDRKGKLSALFADLDQAAKDAAKEGGG